MASCFWGNVSASENITLDNVKTLDPVEAEKLSSRKAIAYVYENLVEYDQEKGEIRPSLAQHWEVDVDSGEGIKDLYFMLRTDTRFQSGSPLTATDVEYTFKRAFVRHSDQQPYFNELSRFLFGVPHGLRSLAEKGMGVCKKLAESIEVVDSYTVVFHLKKADVDRFLRLISQPGSFASIIDKEYTVKVGGWTGDCSNWIKYTKMDKFPLSTRMNGTGPYKMRKYNTTDQKIWLETNDDYWRGSPEEVSISLPTKVENSPPQPTFEFSPVNPKENQVINFYSDSTDPDGSIESYKWEFGDGSSSTKENPIHKYEDSGTYHVRVTVTDNQGATDSTAKEITVEASLATLNISITDNSDKDLNAKIYLNESFEGRTGEDGSYRLTELTPKSYRIKANKSGYSSNSVTVSLSPGEQEDITLTLEKQNKPPIASFTYLPSDPKTNQQINFTSDSSDQGGKIVQYKWEFGDGNRSSEENSVHRYSNPDIYTVELVVEDDEGATDSITKQVTIENRKPTASFTYSPKEPKKGQKITFDATSSTDPDGEIKEYSWDLTGNGITGKSGPKITYTYDKKGAYTVKLTVTDNHGATVSTEKKIKVTEKQEPEEVKIEGKYALVIGIADYKHDTIADLKYPAQDARDFYQFLINDNYESFPQENVTLLTDNQATTQAIRREMSQLVTDVDVNDLAIIFYSGHGAPGPDYNNDEQDGYDEYYVTYDTNTAGGAKLYSTGISDDQFGNWLTSMDSKQVAIFIDSCYSGGATKAAKGTSIPGQKALPNNEVFNDFSFENRLLFAASSENQPSWESKELNQGVFTHFLLQGLKGKADNNNDGEITSDELYDYLKPNVSSYVDENFTSTQTPLMKGAISAPLAEKKGQLEGEVKYVKKAGKKEANKGEYVVIDLGEKDGVKVEDKFKVFLTTKGVGVFEKVNTKIEITKVAGPHLAVGKVLETGLTVEKGFKVRREE